MPNIVPIKRSTALTRQNADRLRLFVQTVGKHLRGSEINEAVEWCEVFKANPLTKQIYFFVFDADDEKKRRMVPVLGINLYRQIANDTDRYRPDDRPARFTYDDDRRSPANPAGIVDCEVTVYKFSHGEWFPITERLRWEERAPIVEGSEFEWVDDPSGALQTEGKWKGKPKRIRQKKAGGNQGPVLDPTKKNWHSMPETMLAKCVEAAAIRKGWPSETSGAYVHEELGLDPNTIDLTATEILEQEGTKDRLARIGGADALIVSWDKDAPTVAVPLGTFYDRVDEHLNKLMAPGQEQAGEALAWAERNRATLRQHWALEKDAALKIKRRIEDIAKAQEAQA